jgi:hypothetical protein
MAGRIFQKLAGVEIVSTMSFYFQCPHPRACGQPEARIRHEKRGVSRGVGGFSRAQGIPKMLSFAPAIALFVAPLPHSHAAQQRRW